MVRFAGLAAGFFGGWTDRLISRLADTIMAFPLFVLAMGIVAALGNTITNIVIATAIINFPLYVRVARAEANVRREAGQSHAPHEQLEREQHRQCEDERGAPLAARDAAQSISSARSSSAERSPL